MNSEKETVKPSPADLAAFRESLAQTMNIDDAKREALQLAGGLDLYDFGLSVGMAQRQMAKHIANFLGLPYIFHIDPGDIKAGVLPPAFCKTNKIVPIDNGEGDIIFVLSNPFNFELDDTLEKINKHPKLLITEPENIDLLLHTNAQRNVTLNSIYKDVASAAKKTTTSRKDSTENHPILAIANKMLFNAVTERASDIHMEPKENDILIRLRVDGDMKDLFRLPTDTGIRLLSRFKAIAGMDIAERRKPQDGTYETMVDNRIFKLRLATTHTPNGESLIIRLLEPGARPKSLKELGMTQEQIKIMTSFAGRTQGMVLIVGPTGTGKTTTIYSLLGQVDCTSRSLISIEDPVEYRIPLANQQEVNVKAGVTFESLLKSAVRQDPDILYLGEVRDPYSAKMMVDFASTGHLTISTMHTANATTAIFRLERLGLSRSVMADALLGIVAQQLIKKLCPHCKVIEAPTAEELEMLGATLGSSPTDISVAHAMGCPKCNNSGYFGRIGVYEVIEITPAISDLIRTGKSVAEIRQFVKDSSAFLISQHAMEKILSFDITTKAAYLKVIVEDLGLDNEKTTTNTKPKAESKTKENTTDAEGRQPLILIVEDDPDTRALIGRILKKEDYELCFAADGIEALLMMGKNAFNLIISDINMPNMDGLQLLEMKNQKGIKTPVIFLTSRSDAEDEIKGFELGAVDYIKKPFKKEILLLRISQTLKSL
jgi:type II secretory ATPase GspE/PulE/Tfp pilus assembly ATPase PilB-like protein/CheY-like chemotaxis protein